MAKIPLSKGYSAIVDDDDFERLSKHKWTAVVTGQNIKRVYAYRREGWDNKKRRWKKAVYLHRSVIDVPKNLDIDHINHDTLDNRKANLRVATRSQNLANNRRQIGMTGFKGVTRSWRGERLPYRAQIKSKTIGTFLHARDAALAYDAAALKEFGEFAKLNFPTRYRRHSGVVSR